MNKDKNENKGKPNEKNPPEKGVGDVIRILKGVRNKASKHLEMLIKNREMSNTSYYYGKMRGIDEALAEITPSKSRKKGKN